MNRMHKDIFVFFKELKKNNNREWFHANKSRYQEIRESFIRLLESLYPALIDLDPSVAGLDIRKTLFRINRDVRFSEDKSPYKLTLAAVLIAGGKRNFDERAGYYIHIENGGSLIAGGAYMPPSNWIGAIRREISSDAETFRSIIGKSSFKEMFGELSGDKLKTAPKGFDRNDPNIDLLRYKSFLAVHNLKNEEVLSDLFSDRIIKVCSELKPLNDFVNSAL